MSKPIIVVADVEREMTDAEYEQYLIDQENAKLIAAKKIEAQQAKTALLHRLGITEEEAKLLLS